MFSYVIFVVFLLFHFIVCFPHCVSEVGDDVDWFYMYKLPRDKGHPNPKVQKGVAYMFMTSRTYKFGWILSEFGIDESNSMLAQTLEPLYQNSSSVFSIIYNDQPPIPESDIAYSNMINVPHKYAQIRHNPAYLTGHTKGVLLGDQYTSVWLVHSVPKFPQVPNDEIPPNESYVYPPTGMKFGQSFLCVSVSTKSVNQIATQLNYNEPVIVYSRLPKGFNGTIDNLKALVQNKSVRAAPWFHIESFESLQGFKFMSFAKSGRFNDDLYAGLVASKLQTDLLTETWINGAGVLDSECHIQYKVYNIEEIKFPLLNVSFTSHFDHSKWTIAESPQSNRIDMPRRYISFLKVILKDLNKRRSESEQSHDYWVCVGDINRAATQERRGGGTLCTSDPFVWQNYKSLVKSVQPCK